MGLYIIITILVNEIFFNSVHMFCHDWHLLYQSNLPKTCDNYYDCVRQGLSESYDILYMGDFPEQDVVKFRMYPKFFM